MDAWLIINGLMHLSTQKIYPLHWFNSIKNIALDLVLGKIIIKDALINHFISSLFGFIPKYDKEFRKIYHLLYYYSSSINDYIIFKVSTLSYLLYQNLFSQIMHPKKHAVLIKLDIKDEFRNISIASHICWLLDFK